MFNDVTSVTLQTAIAGLNTRQQVTANNISNVETPGYIAGTVSFEDSLAQAVSAADPASAQVTTSASGLNPGINGNNVDLASEIVTAQKTTLQESLLTGAMTSKFSLINTVLKG